MARQQPDQIGYADETWNPLRGCWPVGEGCRNCWARWMAARFSGTWKANPFAEDKSAPFYGFAVSTSAGPRWTGRVELIESELDRPLRRRIPTRYAIAFMADWMYRGLPDEARDRILAVEALCKQHRFFHLTKRWKEQAEYFDDSRREKRIWERIWDLAGEGTGGWTHAAEDAILKRGWCWPLPNAIIGNSAWDQPSAEEAWQWLSRTPAAYRLLCLEPLLGPVDLSDLLLATCDMGHVHSNRWKGTSCITCDATLVGLDAVIVGPETGPGRRPCEWSWIRSVVQQCRAAGVPVWVKALLDAKGRKIPFEEWPPDLQVRQMPEVTYA